MRYVMKHFGEDMKDDEVEEFIREADIDGDELIKYRRFVKIIKSKKN